MNLENVRNLGVNEEEIMNLLNLYQFKGKDYYYDNILKNDQGTIIKKNTNKEILNLAMLLKLEVSEPRKKYILKNGGEPKNKQERLFLNLKNSLYKFIGNYNDFEFKAYEINNMALETFNNVENIKFRTYKIKAKSHGFLASEEVVSLRDTLEKMLELFNEKKNSNLYEITNLITNYYIDFINQNIFTSNNDFIGLLSLYMIIISSGFNVFKYVSFFELYNKYFNEFNDAILSAGLHYEDGYSDTKKLNKLIIKVILEAYDQIEEFIHEYTYDTKITKENGIIGIIYHLPQEFTKDDIRAEDPFSSESTINRALQKLQKEKKIRSLGTGRSARWIRLVKEPTFENSRQINLYEIVDDEEDNN